ncbi:MAG: hypothetical protein Ta2G_00190 [Termitinemataceae bacterium]|nr:MAG: hypothetical protein Ta2G_00190 [Termitinemataceae bacterium]
MIVAKIKKHTGLILGIVVVLYPIIVFLSAFVLHTDPRHLSVFIMFFAVAYYFLTRNNYGDKKKYISFISPSILLTIGLVCFFSRAPIVLKLYPMLADIAYIIIVATSLVVPPTLVYYVVDFLDKSIKIKLSKERLDHFCKYSSIVWCVFFFIDGIFAFLTAILIDDKEIFGKMTNADNVWGLYNGVVSYAIMALIFVIQLIIIKNAAKNASQKSASKIAGVK